MIMLNKPNYNLLPLRVDFVGSWLDVADEKRNGGYIINCAISPLVSLKSWPYKIKSGLGGSSAWAILNAMDPFLFEKKHSGGWQDPAIILETGCCVWKSGAKPILEIKNSGDFLNGKLALYDTNISHNANEIAKIERDYNTLIEISKIGRTAILEQDLKKLGNAMLLTYYEQIKEGMAELPKSVKGCLGFKYSGSGHGGYGIYLFNSKKERDNSVKEDKRFQAIEPFCKELVSSD